MSTSSSTDNERFLAFMALQMLQAKEKEAMYRTMRTRFLELIDLAGTEADMPPEMVKLARTALGGLNYLEPTFKRLLLRVATSLLEPINACHRDGNRLEVLLRKLSAHEASTEWVIAQAMGPAGRIQRQEAKEEADVIELVKDLQQELNPKAETPFATWWCPDQTCRIISTQLSPEQEEYPFCPDCGARLVRADPEKPDPYTNLY